MKLKNGEYVGQLKSPKLGTVISFRKDGSVQSALVKAKDPKTLGMTYQRIKMPNLSNLYKACKKPLRDAFEGSSTLWRELVRYNINGQHEPIGITKAMRQSGACIVAPYQISKGELSPIVVENAISNIALDGLTSITAATTVGQLADAIVKGNPGNFEYGDRIVFIEIKQSIDAKGMPVVGANCTAITLTQDSAVTLAGLSLKGFGVIDECLAVKGAPATGAYAWIHTRRDDETQTLLVSTQSLINNNEAFVAKYSAPDALKEAATSYGANMADASLLDPSSAKARKVARKFGIALKETESMDSAAQDAILSVLYNGVNYMRNDEAPILDTDTAAQLKVTVSDGSQLGSVVTAKVNGESATGVTRTGNEITMTLPDAVNGDQLAIVLVADADHNWKMEF